MSTIGFMQGRLSPLVDGKIQAFPEKYWRDEFALAKQHDFSLMEWTLDQKNLYENPLMHEAGRKEIIALSEKYELTIQSLTGDCFMQAPFYKTGGSERKSLLQDFVNIIDACVAVNIQYIVFPLVDDGALNNVQHEDNLRHGLEEIQSYLLNKKVIVIFESDFSPVRLKTFIQSLPSKCFAINYDIGNSAGLGYDSHAEFVAYGHRILNIHVKDRLFASTTVPLGQGSADFPKVFDAIKKSGYQGDYILQTARADNDDHVGVLCEYRDMVKSWI